MESKRQLAAIMFTDIVGYTKLMGSDEIKALELLQKNRMVQKPIIEKLNGKWIKEIGDGVLASFNTVSDAVHCAVAIQENCKNEPDLKLRIGIHLGEVVFEGEDVFGDGVNIASRLEAIAPAGGIYISDSVNRNIQNKQGFESRFIKEELLKNVKEPVRIYEVRGKGVDFTKSILNSSSQPVEKKTLHSSTRKIVFISIVVVAALALIYFFYQFRLNAETDDAPRTIAVLAFDDQSPDGDQEWLGDGMADEILNVLAKVDALQVTGKTSSFSFKGKDATIGQIGEALSVKTVLEGSINKVGNKLRITAQLIDVESETHIWSEKYDRDANEIFDVIDEVAQKITGSLMTELSNEEIEKIGMMFKPNPEAYAYFIRAEHIHYNEYHVVSFDNNTFLKAKEMYQKAINIDPDFMDALAGLANLYDTKFSSGKGGDYTRDSLLSIAYQTNPESPYVLYLKGYLSRDLDSAFILLSKAYKVNAVHSASTLLINKCRNVGFYDLTIDLCQKYLAVDPLNETNITFLIEALQSSGQVDEARNQIKKLLEFNENNLWGIQYLFLITLIEDCDIPEAEKLLDKMVKISPGARFIDSMKALLLAAEGEKDKALLQSPNDAMVYSLLDMQEEALESIAQMIDQINNSSVNPYTGYFGYLSLKGDYFFDKIRQEPQFQEWLEEAKVLHEERVAKYYHLFDD